MFAVTEVDSRRRHLVGERLTIGRAPDNDLRLEDRMVSLHHAEIVRGADGTFRLRDVGSRHGTFVANQKVQESPLRLGDELLIGPVRLRVEGAAASDELHKLRAIVELSRAIGVDHDLERLLGRVLDTCFQLLGADRGMIVTYAPGSKTPCAIVARTRDGVRIDEALSTSVLSQVLATREPYLRTEIDGDFARSESLSLVGVRSLVAVPLMYESNEWLGVINLDSCAADRLFAQSDLELLGAIAGQAALAIKNAMLVRQMQAARGAELRRLQRIVGDLPVGVLVLDDQRRCVLANEWLVQRRELLGGFAEREVVDALAGLPIERVLGTERRHQVAIGETTLVLAGHASADGAESVIVVSDITLERQQHAKAAHQDRLAAVGQLAGGIAHDFNNLLFVIMANAEFLAESSTVEQVKDAEDLIQAARSASDLTRQLLAFSRREAVKPMVVDLAELVGSREHMLARAIGPDVALTIRARPAFVLADPSQLEQVIMNLAVNARDAMGGKGALAIDIVQTATHASIAITDTGSGMPPEVVARIFEPYFTTKARGKGTGLGLATVHGIVHEAGGVIEVRSEVGRGSTFTVTLPLTDLAPARTRTRSRIATGRGRVLVVDDDAQVRQLTSRMLHRAGYEVIAVESGAAALDVARETHFDLAITDCVMPGMSGRDLARELAVHAPATHVVLMSAYPPPQGEKLPFLAKPFDRAGLLAVLGMRSTIVA